MNTERTRLVFATNNQHKLKEIKSMLGEAVEILSLKDIGCYDELPETSSTLKGNSIQKATYVFEKYGAECFSDDTGLEIESLGGRPGVYSARFAGLHCSFEDNIEKVLTEMKGIENRRAVFKTVITLVTGKGTICFEGHINGEITRERLGLSGFGYDPVFLPEGSHQTFAEMNESEKNKISHRAKALEQLVAYLKMGQPNVAART